MPEPVAAKGKAGGEPDFSAELVADDRGRYVDCNQAACKLLGYERDEILRMSVWDLTPQANNVDGLIMWQEFIALGVQAGIYWLVRKDGTSLEVEFRAVANVAPGRHLSRLRAIDTGRPPFPASRLPRHRT